MSEISKKTGVSADIKKNRMYITITEQMTAKVLSQVYTDVRFCAADLTPGFDVVTDLLDCNLAALTGIPTFKKIIRYLISLKAGQIVRVTNKKNVLFQQLINLASRMNGYSPIYVHTLKEAEQVLENSQHREGLRLSLQNQPAYYTVADKKGEGIIIDISTSGCALKGANISPALNDIITFTTTFKPVTDQMETFTTKAKVIWEKNNYFAVKYEQLDKNQSEALWKRLVHESYKELF